MRFFNIDRENWPCGVSDGLSLPCSVCDSKVYFDYGVTDELWAQVIPKRMKRSVVCLPCLDALAKEKGLNIGPHMRFIQFTGRGETIEFMPANVFWYDSK